jgi:hypothetical protein
VVGEVSDGEGGATGTLRKTTQHNSRTDRSIGVNLEPWNQATLERRVSPMTAQVLLGGDVGRIGFSSNTSQTAMRS